AVRSGEVRHVHIRGEIDLATAPELEAKVQHAFDGDTSVMLCALEALTFIDSSGLRALVALSNQAGERGIPLMLRNVPRHAQRVLDLTGLSDFFNTPNAS